MHGRWHEDTRYMTQEGGQKGKKDTGRDLATARHLKKRCQTVIGFEGRKV